MDRKLRNLVLKGLLPRIVRELKLKHRECAERYEVFFDSMQEVFSREFISDPIGTMERYLSLSDEECAWEKGDFRTRDLLLDNFIGREIARALRRELERLGYYEEIYFLSWRDFKRIPEIFRENSELRREVERPRQEIREAGQENRVLREELEEVLKSKDVEELIERVQELKKELASTRQRCRMLETRLTALLMAPQAKKLSEMALILRAALNHGHAMPAMLIKETKLKRYRVQALLRELNSLGLVARQVRGFYTPADVPEGEVELAIAKRMVRRWMSSE